MKEKGMRSAEMPQQHFEKKFDEIKPCDLRYGGEFDQEQTYAKSEKALVNYVKKHKMQY